MERRESVELYSKLVKMYDELWTLKSTIYMDPLKPDNNAFYLGIIYGHIEAARDELANATAWMTATLGIKKEDINSERSERTGHDQPAPVGGDR